MKTVQITEASVLKAHNEASSKGKNLLENLFGDSVFKRDIKDRIKNVNDAIRLLGDEDQDVIDYWRIESTGVTSHVIWNQKLIMITKALNEDWIPDWHNGEYDKWYNWWNMSSSSSGRFAFLGSAYLYSDSFVGSRLCFKSKELAQYAAKQFKDIYEKAYTI